MLCKIPTTKTRTFEIKDRAKQTEMISFDFCLVFFYSLHFSLPPIIKMFKCIPSQPLIPNNRACARPPTNFFNCTYNVFNTLMNPLVMHSTASSMTEHLWWTLIFHHRLRICLATFIFQIKHFNGLSILYIFFSWCCLVSSAKASVIQMLSMQR